MNFRVAPIGDLVEPIQTWNPTTRPDAMFAYVDLSAVDQVEKKINISNEIRGSEAPSRARQVIRSGDVLISTVRPNLNGVASVTQEFDGATASTGFCVLRPVADRLDSQYLMHWVRSPTFVGDMVREATGASYPAVSDRIVKASSIPLPPLDEQRRIAAILDKADALRRKRKRALDVLDSLIQSIFLEMFGSGAASPVERKPLSALTTEIYRYPTYYGIEYAEKGVPEIRGELISDDGAIVDDEAKLRFISAETSSRFPKTVLSPGDLVMSVRGTIGKIGQVPSSLNGANITANLIRIAPDRKRVDPLFLRHAMQTEATMRALKRISSSTTIATIKASDLRSLELPSPTLEDQRRFAALVDRQQESLCVAKENAGCFDALFYALQSRAFSGQL